MSEASFSSTTIHDPVLPRQRRLPKRIDDGASSYIYSSLEELYRHQYYEAIDLLIAQIQRQFDQPTFAILQEMEKVLIGSCNRENVQLSSSFEELYESDLKMETFKVQLSMLANVILTANKDYNLGIKQVTTVKHFAKYLMSVNSQRPCLVKLTVCYVFI